MTKTIRKNRTLEQKQKRRSSHQVGKQFHVSSASKKHESMNVLLKTKMLLDTNKEYRRAENQQVLGSFLGFIVAVYICVGVVYFYSVKVVKSYALQVVLKFISLGFLKPSSTDQFREPTVWEVFKRYSMGQPIIAGVIVILLLATSIIFISKGHKMQNIIEANVDEEKLRKEYENFKRKGT